MSVEQEVATKQQEKQPAIGFDQKIEGLFADRPSALKDISTFIKAPDRFTDEWWNGLYKWLDVRDFHGEKYSIAQITLESLDTLPADAKLPSAMKHWISHINGWQKTEPVRKQIVNALRNPSIPLSLRTQLGKHLAESNVSSYSVNTIMQAYGILGEDIGEEVRKQILPLFVAGLAYDQYDLHREGLVKLYEEGIVKEANIPTNPGKLTKMRSLLSKVSANFKLKTHKEPQSLEAESMDKKRLAERRMEVSRNLVLDLFPPIPKDQDPERGKWERLKSFTGVFPNPCKAVSSDMLTLPVETLEKYLADLQQLKELPEFTNLSSRFFSDEGIVAPYTALGNASSDWNFEKRISIRSIFHHLSGLDQSGSLDDRIVDEVLLGMNKNLFSNDQVKTVARRNLKILMKHQLPQEAHISQISPLLTIPEENVLNDGLETITAIRDRDKTTADILLLALPRFRVFGDKYKIALDYIRRKREREDLRRIGAITHEDYVSEALKAIQLTDSGVRQGERLVKLAVSLDTISESNEALQLGISDAGIVPDLKTSYENVQNTLKGILQQLGIADIDEAYKFLPWIKTKDETALKILRGEEVAKVGEARSYNLQASSKLDLGGMKKDIKSYAKAIGLDLPEVPVEDLNLELLKQIATDVIAELSKRKDISKEVLGEVKPNLDRIIASMSKGGNYTFSINPQDIKAQLEALQNVGSCLSPGGSRFRYTKEYLKNPNTSWATIKGTQGVVGRVTMFRGTDESGNPAFARVSKVYAQVPIDENEVDKALRNYADETNTTFVEKGKINVPGLQDFYDDFIGTGRGSAVVINR